ncbi:hypothetical protein CHU92_10475 [Flavobacterium cyanobacteriorum]|uniref:Transporter n=1 Tax=Flavobacterium cyanobacteriorum TaxID=2022802 RepID=A0A255Z515_9FLAO|nr:TolC family protein [Flavobacterium cyanobacteriorum]OYQ32982.1 hypothetical protein CHU92_13755 [Flavobacterium cyanobacteriorum]OYQ35730.1 hypothetical protein CHU92_10475 [Flavobacterium cyanobacteriorum]
MSIPLTRSIACILLFLCPGLLLAQEPLDNYIEQGLKNNTVVRQKNIALQTALAALKEAKGYFLPDVSFSTSYQSGEGGRYFNFPVGDLVNPVYATLNQLTGSGNFPQLENIRSYLNPNNYYDAHVRTSVPIVNTDVYYNYRIKQQQAALPEHELAIYKRELVAGIRNAYYNYLMMLENIAIYENALALVNQNLKVNESLYRNGKGLQANIKRAESEIAGLNAQLLQAKNELDNARRYFNFLINQNLNAPVETVPGNNADPEKYAALINIKNTREELQQLDQALEINKTALKMDRSFWIPKISAFLDLGSQGIDWEYNGYSRYYFAGIQMDIKLFKGQANTHKAQQRKLDIQKLELDKENITRQLDMASQNALSNYYSSKAQLEAASANIKASESYFRVIESGYRQGANTLIEYIDARNQLTQSQLSGNIARYRVLAALTDIERQNATYKINQTNQ